MKGLKIIFTVSTILFAFLGLAGVLEYDVSQPIMFSCLGLLNLITSKEYSNKGDSKTAKYFLIVSIFIFGVIIVTLVGKYCL